jgi:hypothetical protein
MKSFPDEATARRDLAWSEVEQVERQDIYAAAEAEHRAKAAASETAAVAYRGAELEQRTAHRAAEEARAAEQQSFKNGTALLVDVDAAEIGLLRAGRKLAALKAACEAPAAAAAEATLQLQEARGWLGNSKYLGARARFNLAASVELPKLIAKLGPLLTAAEVAARGAGPNSATALREVRGMRDQIAHALGALLNEDAARAQHKPDSADEEKIRMRVRPNERYDDVGPGGVVYVTEADLRSNAIKSALMTEAEYDARESAKVEQEKPRPQHVVPPTVAIVNEALRKMAEHAAHAQGKDQ